MILIATIRLFTFSTSAGSDDEKYAEFFRENYKIFSVNVPNDLNFAGEQVPLQDFEVRERLDREFLVNTYWQSQTLLLAKKANRWFPVILPILKKNGIPEDFKYMVAVESGFSLGVSAKGAAGYWQFMAPTAESYGLTINEEVDERYNVVKSTEAACRFFKENYKVFKSWTLAAAAYNIGTNGLQRALDKQKVSSYYDLLLNEETSRYMFRVLALKEILSKPDQYGFIIRKKDLYPPLPSTEITVDTTINDLTAFATQQGLNYKLLKYFNPWLRSDKLTAAAGRKYFIRIPHKSIRNYDELKQLSEEENKNDEVIKKDSVLGH
jgi:hypothetical protein